MVKVGDYTFWVAYSLVLFLPDEVLTFPPPYKNFVLEINYVPWSKR